MGGNSSAARLALELDVESNSVSGSVKDQAGTVREFSGWLGLAAAIEELASDPHHDDRETTK